MNELQALWERYEKKAIGLVLLSFLALQVVSEFAPQVDSFMTRRGSLILIALAQLFIFRYLSNKLELQKAGDLAHIETFSQGLVSFFREKQTCDTVDIQAHDGTMYFLAITESKVKIKNLRLLLRSAEDINTMRFPSDDAAKQGYKEQLKSKVDSWMQLKENGQIKNLSIRYYLHDPTGYFMIVNNKELHFGLLKPKHKFPGTDIMNSFIANTASLSGKNLLSDYKMLFDTIWNEFGQSTERINSHQQEASQPLQTGMNSPTI